MTTPERKETTYWVITSAKKRAIWRKSYDTEQEAITELDKQMALLSPEQKAATDWVIEKRKCWITATNSKSTEDERRDEVWNNF